MERVHNNHPYKPLDNQSMEIRIIKLFLSDVASNFQANISDILLIFELPRAELYVEKFSYKLLTLTKYRSPYIVAIYMHIPKLICILLKNAARSMGPVMI